MNRAPKGGALMAAEVYYRSGIARAEAGMARPAPRQDVSRVVSIQKPEDWGYSGEPAAGVSVTDRSAMGHSAFFANVRLISSTFGSLPVGVFRKDEAGVKTAAKDSPLYFVLHDSPNSEQSPTDYWEAAMIGLLIRGNHYARKLKSVSGRLVGLEAIRPDLMYVRREGGKLRYRWIVDGRQHDAGQDEIFHLRGFGGGPVGGLSTIAYARESLGIAIAGDRAAGAMFANGMKPSGALQSDLVMNTEQRSEAEARLQEKYRGAMNAGVPLLLDNGLKWQSITMNADDAQLLQSRSWSVEDICRWFGTPPVLVGHNEKTTSWGTGIEQLILAFLKFCLNPYLRRTREAIWKQLMTPAERASGLFAEFNLEGLLAADSKGRAGFYQAMTQIGAMTINEVRALENLPPVPGGDVPRIQMQNQPIDQADAPEETK